MTTPPWTVAAPVMGMHPATAAKELLDRREARGSFLGYSRYMQPDNEQPALHHELICNTLDQVEKGEIDRVMLFLPPGSAKSTYGSTLFPQYFLGRNPQLTVIAGSHTQDLANRFSRRTRNGISQQRFADLFPQCRMASDSASVLSWETTQGGEYKPVGVGGNITGRRGDLVIIDDPVKSREDADSDIKRETVWQWWLNDVKTRMKPGGRVVLIMCMTGDTPVLRPDGVETPLRSIRPGDEVATYKDGSLTVAVVKNWINQGPDDIYSIRMTSGRTVRANARHPFLVVGEDGGESWVRLESLKAGMLVRSVEGLTPVSCALSMGASQALRARACARPTTGKRAGPQDIGRHPATTPIDARFDSKADTASQPPTTTECSPSKMGAAASVERTPTKLSDQSTGLQSSASTTTTTPESCAGCSATIATSSSVEREQSPLFGRPLLTWSVGTDEIAEIAPAGREDVFDIEVEGTHNFIANGLTASNTRWHEDDLAGRLLEMEKDRWTVIKVPMIATKNDPLGRNPGERLWADWFTEQMVLDAQADPRSWTSLYQQDPRPPEGAEFKRSWINRFDHWPAKSNKILLVDPSGGRDAKSDFTSMWVLALGRDHNIYVVDGVRARLNLTARADKLFELHQKWRPMQTRYEHYGMQADVEHIKSQMEVRDYRFKIFEVGGAVQKESRIRRLIPWFENGRIWFPKAGLMRITSPGVEEDIVKNFIEQEYAAFPVGKFDDSFDNLARLAEPSMTLPWPKASDPNESDVADMLFGVLDNVAGY